jgi:predicted Zn-dependent protease
MNHPHYETILQKVLSKAGHAGAEHAAAVLSHETSGTLRFAANRPTQHKTHQNTSLSLAVAIAGKEAICETNLLEDNDLDSLAARAVQFARNAPINPEFFEPISRQKYVDTDAWFDSTAKVSVSKRGDVVKEMCDRAESENTDLFGNLKISSGQIAVANTTGLFADQPVTEVALSLTAKTRHSNGSSQAHLWERDWNKFTYMKSAERTIAVARNSANPKPLDPGHYTVILSPKAVSEYLMFVILGMDARMADNGQSFFGKKSNKSRLDERCFQDNVTIKSMVDHPELPTPRFGRAFGSGGSAAGAVFSTGLPVQTTVWIENGMVKNFRYSPWYALEKKRFPIAYPYNLYMSGDSAPLDELISGVDRGLLIESFWYVNPTDWHRLELTGLTRDGTFLIENGKISWPVNSFRFNDSPVRSLNNVTGMTQPEKVYGEYWPGMFPWIRIEDFNLSSISNAV